MRRFNFGRVNISERLECPRRVKLLILACALAAALAVISVILLFMGFNPFDVYAKMLTGSLGSLYSFKWVLTRTIPLALTSVGILYTFRIRFWNIGGEGQIFMGAFAASAVALFAPEASRPLTLLLMAAAGFAGGAVWALIPGLFKVFRNMNETIVTLMLNYIAVRWISYLQYSAWKDPGSLGFPKIKFFPQRAILPEFLGIHAGFYILIFITIFTFVLFRYTKFGFRMSILGESDDTARYVRLKKTSLTLLSVAISGGICGITGMIQASAVNNTLNVSVTSGVGFTAIIISWLSNMNPVVCVLVAFLFSTLSEGASYIQTVFRIPESIAMLIQSIVMLFVIGSTFFTRYSLTVKGHDESLPPGPGAPGATGAETRREEV